MAKKCSPSWQKWRENVRHFRHHDENGEKIDGENGKMARKSMARKSIARMTRIAKIDGEKFIAIFAMAKAENR